MRIPLTNIEIVSAKTLEARIKARADINSADILKRYAHNPEICRAAIAAQLGLSDPRFVLPTSMLIAPMTKAIEAFSDAVTKERAGITRAVRP